MTTRKIETGCYAVIRATGEAVLVGKKYSGYLRGPATFTTSAGGVDTGEYMASELKRVDAAQFAALEETAEYRLWQKCGF